MNEFDQYKFIFLCGLHRSGTSPLFQILRKHPEISGFHDTGAPEDEGQHLQTVFLPGKAYGGPGHFGLMPEAHLTEESDLVTHENRHKLFEEWSRYWDLSRPYLLEKSPPNLVRTRFLQSAFPRSYFIVIVRHPVAVSLATRKWARGSVESLTKHWLRCHGLFELDHPYLHHVLVIKYEDLIRATEATLEQIYRFLELPSHFTAPLSPAGNDRYFSAWQRLSADSRGKAIFRHVVAKYEKEVRHYGYSLADCGAVIPAILPFQWSQGIHRQNAKLTTN